MDVVKTRLQTQGSMAAMGKEVVTSVKYTGALNAVSRIYAEEGIMAFTRGLAPRLALHMPASAISWTTYELVKAFLAEGNFLSDR